MTEQELEYWSNKIADLVIKGIIEKQKELDQNFFAEAKKHGYELEVSDFAGPGDQEEIILGEIARLMTMLDLHVQNEDYEKAAIIKNKINHLENKLKR